jgi:hypothetical protein
LQTFTAGGTEVVLGLFGRCTKIGLERPNPQKFVSKDVTFMLFEFNGRRYLPKSTEFFDSGPVDVRNYEPEIRIY